MDWTTLLNQQAIIGLVQLLLGKWLKGIKEYENRWIPVATFFLAVLGFSIAPVIANAIGVSTPVAPENGVFLSSVIQTLMVTGVHSFCKNTLQPAFKRLFSWFGGLGGRKDK